MERRRPLAAPPLADPPLAAPHAGRADAALHERRERLDELLDLAELGAHARARPAVLLDHAERLQKGGG